MVGKSCFVGSFGLYAKCINRALGILMLELIECDLVSAMRIAFGVRLFTGIGFFSLIGHPQLGRDQHFCQNVYLARIIRCYATVDLQECNFAGHMLFFTEFKSGIFNLNGPTRNKF